LEAEEASSAAIRQDTVTQQSEIMRPRPVWYRSSLLVLLGAMLLLAYILFVQAIAVYHEVAAGAADFPELLFGRALKSMFLIAALSLFIFYFSIQDYHMAIDKLLESFSGLEAVAAAADERSEEVDGRQNRSSFRAAIGSSQAQVSGISRSYAEAVDALQYRRTIGDDSPVAAYCSQSPPVGDSPESAFFKCETQFMSCIESEDFEHAERIYMEMLDSSYLKLASGTEQAKYRLLGLSNSMVAALGRLHVSAASGKPDIHAMKSEITSKGSLPELKEAAQEIFDLLKAYSQNIKQEPYNKRMSEIANYVRLNYADHNLSVNLIAATFGISPAYLSHTFKRDVGVGLASFIQDTRIRAAKELLRDPKVSVREAAERVGFNSVLTLNRSFRRQEGTTAGRLRNIQLN